MAPLESKVLCCIKCPKTGEVKLNNKDIYCQGCFVHYVTHKFRGCLGKHKAIKNGEKVMVAISGGHSSTAMLNLLHSGFREEIHKKLKVTLLVDMIDRDSFSCHRIFFFR